MTKTPLIRVAKPGKSVFSSDIRDIAFDSRMPVYCPKMVKSASLVLNAGQQYGYVDIPHNLQHVRKFLAYLNGELFPPFSRCYSTNGMIHVGVDWGSQYNLSTYELNDMYDAAYGARYYIIMGNRNGTGRDCAVRFANIGIPRHTTIQSATLDIRVGSDTFCRGTGTGNLLLRAYGMNEDNTGDFSSYPMSRPTTNAVTYVNNVMPPNNETFRINVTSQVQEIVNRSGWSAGNALGFLILNNNSNTDVYIQANEFTGYAAQLIIVLAGNLNFNCQVVILKDKIIN